MALIGALRAGVINWRAEKWQEWFTGGCGASYSEGPLQDEDSSPKYGWPDYFWQPLMAADNVLWQNNFFTSRGTVTLLTARYKVGLWMSSNNDATADWLSTADEVFFDWGDVNKSLVGPGWQAWIVEAHIEKTLPKRSWRYVDALIQMIGIAVHEPELVKDQRTLFEQLHRAFDNYGHVPDERDLKKLAARIAEAVQPPVRDPAP